MMVLFFMGVMLSANAHAATFKEGVDGFFGGIQLFVAKVSNSVNSFLAGTPSNPIYTPKPVLTNEVRALEDDILDYINLHKNEIDASYLTQEGYNTVQIDVIDKGQVVYSVLAKAQGETITSVERVYSNTNADVRVTILRNTLEILWYNYNLNYDNSVLQQQLLNHFLGGRITVSPSSVVDNFYNKYVV